MSFANTSGTSAQTSKTEKRTFLRLDAGTYNIRILDDHAYDIWTHYLNGYTIECLGDECPICLNNRSLYMQYPDSFKDEPGYSPRTRRYMVNVLDKTPVRTCQKCGEEYADKSVTTCSKCKEIIAGDQLAPSGKVKILARGVTLFDQLNAIESAVLDEKGKVIGLTNYDITLIVSGTGKSKVITPIPVVTGDKTPIPDGLVKYDLEDATIKLTGPEILELKRGISLRDIFSARRAANPVSTVGAVSGDLEQAAREKVEDLFKE